MRYNKTYYITVAIAVIVIATVKWIYEYFKGLNEAFQSEKPKPFITFIIPSVGRPEIDMTLRSLLGLRNPNWKAIVIYDGVSVSPTVVDPRIEVVHNEKLGSAGATRNAAVGRVQTDWVGFVDDDDALSPDYIDKLQSSISEMPAVDIVAFSLRFTNGNIQPRKNNGPILYYQNIGISFAIKTAVLKEIPFKPIYAEDFTLLQDAHKAGKRILMSEYITYAVRPSESDVANPQYWKDNYETARSVRHVVSDVQGTKS